MGNEVNIQINLHSNGRSFAENILSFYINNYMLGLNIGNQTCRSEDDVYLDLSMPLSVGQPSVWLDFIWEDSSYEKEN